MAEETQTQEQIAANEKAASDKAALDKVATDKAASDKAAQDKSDKDSKNWEEIARRRGDEAAAARLKIKEFEDKETERERKKNEEDKDYQKLVENERKRADKIEKDAKDREEKANERVLNTELRAKAREMGLIDTDLIMLLDRKGIKLNDDGEVEGVDEAFAALKKAKPSLFKAGEEDTTTTRRGSRTTPPNSSSTSPDPKKDYSASKVPSDEFNKIWDTLGTKRSA